MTAELLRQVDALASEFAVEHGVVDLVDRRVDCSPDEYDALVETSTPSASSAGRACGRDDDGRVLLARYESADGWVDPGNGRRPGESYRECAVRGVRETTGLDPEDDLAQVHLLYMDDPTGSRYRTRTSSSRAGRRAGTPAPGTSVREGVADLRRAETIPESLLYDELAELALPD